MASLGSFCALKRSWSVLDNTRGVLCFPRPDAWRSGDCATPQAVGVGALLFYLSPCHRGLRPSFNPGSLCQFQTAHTKICAGFSLQGKKGDWYLLCCGAKK